VLSDGFGAQMLLRSVSAPSTRADADVGQEGRGTEHHTLPHHRHDQGTPLT
jgi:hypothetical protein